MIFISAMSHAAAKSVNEYWTSESEEANKAKSSAKKQQTILVTSSCNSLISLQWRNLGLCHPGQI